MSIAALGEIRIEISRSSNAGPNAIRVLHDLEILDEILARVSPGELAPRPFLFLSGLDGHETVFDVCFITDGSLPKTDCFSTPHLLRTQV